MVRRERHNLILLNPFTTTSSLDIFAAVRDCFINDIYLPSCFVGCGYNRRRESCPSQSNYHKVRETMSFYARRVMTTMGASPLLLLSSLSRSIAREFARPRDVTDFLQHRNCGHTSRQYWCTAIGCYGLPSCTSEKIALQTL
jgi:hypothetical protein